MASRVPDVRLRENRFFPKYNVTMDWSLLLDGRLDDTQALATAICVALGTNRLADANDELPDPDSTDRMGWWADMDAEAIWGGWPIGSRLWTLSRSKILDRGNGPPGATVARVRFYIMEALQPFVQAGVFSRFDVYTTLIPPQEIDALIQISRGPLPNIELRYQILWDELIASSAG
jgi:phage gp46-like protein